MSFLDSLENNLKALESREERDPEKIARDKAARKAEADQARSIAPFAEALRNGPFAGSLIEAARIIGRQHRLAVRPTWIDGAFRLEARDRKIELRPTSTGVRAFFYEGDTETGSEPVDLSGSAEPLARRWLENL